MRGLEKKLHEKGTTFKQRNKERNKHTSRLLDQLLPSLPRGKKIDGVGPVGYRPSTNKDGADLEKTNSMKSGELNKKIIFQISTKFGS